jgi:cell division control protein 6
MKLGQSKEDKLRRVTLQIDISDIGFAFKVQIEALNCII